MLSLVRLTFFFFLFLNGSYGRETMTNWIRESIDKYSINFRVMNGTHKFGSSSSINGAYGVVQMVSSLSDVDWILNRAEAGPYIAVVNSRTFQKDYLPALLNSEKISGVVLTSLYDINAPNNYSFDSTCPNDNFGSYSCEVNPYGNSFLLNDWPVPLMLVENAAGVKAINDCYKKFNLPLDSSQSSRALCSLHMKSHMFAAVNSEVCMRRNNYGILHSVKYCDPMGGQSVILPVGNFWTKEKRNVAIISARIDAASMFDGVAPGAMASVTGIITLLTSAYILRNLLDLSKEECDNAVIFALLNGEAYDYIGSSRMVYDIGKNTFPLKDSALSMEEVSMFIDISQPSGSSVYLHTKNGDKKDIKAFIQNFTSFGKSYKLDLETVEMKPYLPTSYQSFAKVAPEIPGLVVTNYKEKFFNRYYHGLYDTNENINYSYKNGSAVEQNSIQNWISAISLSLAYSAYQFLTGKNVFKNFSTDEYSPLVDELFHCYLDTNHCKYMTAVITKDILIKEEPESLYVGVDRGSDVVPKLTGRILAFLSSPVVPLSSKNCTYGDITQPYNYIWMNGLSGDGICVNTSIKFITAVSPAFDIDGYNWSSGEYSTWTESTWHELDLYLFLKPPPYQEYITFAVGIIVLLVSFVTVYFLSANNLSSTSTENAPSI